MSRAANRLGLASMFALALGIDARAGVTPPGDAAPFLCVSGVGVGVEVALVCRRADDGVIITPVPAGLYLYVTDIVVNPNNVATSGVFTASIGRDDASEFPNTPSLDLIGSPTQQLHFTTPYLVLRGGEQLATRNDADSPFPIDVRVSGYLAGTFVEQPPAIFSDGFESS